jgi:MraZ protein
MFRGIFETTIDAKGRTSLPAKFREVLIEKFNDARFFITKSSPVSLGEERFTAGLVIYPFKEWSAVEEKLQNGAGLGLTSAQLDSVKRTMVASAVDCTADKLGRVLVPPNLRKHASLEREIVFVGSLKKIEIWSLAEWEKVLAQDMKNFPADTQALAELGL